MDTPNPAENSNTPTATDTWRDWLKVAAPVLLLTAAAFALAWHFVQPAPPAHVTIATGSASGMYYKFAKDYADYFTENGVHLDVRETGGTLDNYKLLTTPDSGVDIAIVQSGCAPPKEQRPHLQSVAGICYEAIFVFYRGETAITELSQLAGKKISVGGEGSGIRAVAPKLLEEAGVTDGDAKGTTFVDISGDKALDALKAGTLDAMFIVTTPDAPVVAKAFDVPGVHLMSFDQSRAYGRRYAFFSPVTLYRGSLDIRRNIPDADVQLIGSPAMLVIRDTTHEAIIQLLVGAARKLHRGGTLLSDPGSFPVSDRTELPVNKDAIYFLTAAPSFLHRTFPFWLASLIDRLLIMLLPFLVVLIPLFRMMPGIYVWRTRSKIYKWYNRVRAVDERLLENSPISLIEAGRKDLMEVEKEVAAIKVPASYMEELYNLRVHLDFVRVRLDSWLKHRSAAEAAPASAGG